MPIHTKAHTMSGHIVKIGSGQFAGADFRIIDWIDHGDHIPTADQLAAYEADRIAQGHPIGNDVVLGQLGDLGTILKHVEDLDLEHSRSKTPNTTGIVG